MQSVENLNFKLHTDGSALYNPGPAASGWSIRDHSGKWNAGFATRIGVTSALGAELRGGARDGLITARDLNI
ncbi:hypothetical protein SLEP1_g13086 [Rubroshorea leprosula]|uniref:RNase H type-1 domain-containing protein n=1 Tax=Rubroshorea leprosula TaxID=152421 RepID=A0AAV5IKE6_9ROSI|nr:hypothetical protein SLEP1_g13086 [Rubroshorea leprosula]